MSHQTSHIFTRTLSECDIVRVNVAIVYGDDSFVASVVKRYFKETGHVSQIHLLLTNEANTELTFK